MPAEMPVGFDIELQGRLKDKLGDNWADQLALKWGADWAVPCSTELERSLGFGWESQPPDTKSETLLKLISTPVAEPKAPEPAWPDPASQAEDIVAEGELEVPAYDERVWQAYLAENGPQWDGTEATWSPFKEWFAYHANEQGLAGPAKALLDYLSSQPVAERTTTLLQYGVTIRPAAQPEAAAPGEPAYDEQAWLAYAAKNGRQWDGTEATWDQFTEWFAYYANEQGLATPAAALLRYLSSQSVAERMTTLRPGGESAGEEPEEPDTPEAADEDIEEIMRELLDESPELADVPEDLRRELVIEAINEVLAEEGAP